MPDIGGGAFELHRRAKPIVVKEDQSQLDLTNDKQRITYVKKVFKEAQKSKTQRSCGKLKAALAESRDTALAKARPLQVPNRTRLFPRLPSTADGPVEANLYCQIISNAEGKKESLARGNEREDIATSAPESAMKGRSTEVHKSKKHATSTNELDPNKSNSKPASIDNDDEEKGLVSVRIRNHKYRGSELSMPANYLEGAHKPHPRSSATVFLKTNYAADDEQNLTYIPYFGDDDNEDVVSDVYNLDEKVKQVELGLAHEEIGRNEAIDKTIRLLTTRLADDGKEVSDVVLELMFEDLADLFDVDVKRIFKRYETLDEGPEIDHSPPSETKNVARPKINSSTHVRLPYEEVMDSYRSIFCRQCFTYDCNMHGNLNKPDVGLQGELAVRKQREGFWETSDVDVPDATGNEIFEAYSTGDSYQDGGLQSRFRKRSFSSMASDEQSSSPDSPEKCSTELTALQKSICDRAFLIFQSDTEKMAAALDAPHDLVVDFVASEKMSLGDFQYELPESGEDRNKKEKKSMKNYNLDWLRRVEDAEIHPMFHPCDHFGPCSVENCSCVRNRFFCTKHCVWGEKSPNFFRGCSCKGAKTCRTNSCACFAAKRECDPDLCRTCGTCTDPPNRPATTQKCQNDSMGMRRHCHLLLAESTIPDAGWGIFTKTALKKGDFVHEYVGEVISQEEAERRGRIYDKVNRSYLFNLCSDFVVDASRKGNKTRYANHSSTPNCYTKMVRVNGDIRIGLFAKEDIEPQSELFFDYRYDVGMDNDLIIKPSKTVDWMEDPKMANQISKKNRAEE